MCNNVVKQPGNTLKAGPSNLVTGKAGLGVSSPLACTVKTTTTQMQRSLPLCFQLVFHQFGFINLQWPLYSYIWHGMVCWHSTWYRFSPQTVNSLDTSWGQLSDTSFSGRPYIASRFCSPSMMFPYLARIFTWWRLPTALRCMLSQRIIQVLSKITGSCPLPQSDHIIRDSLIFFFFRSDWLWQDDAV